MGKETYFWIFSAAVVAASLFIPEIDLLVNQFFGGYHGFINTSLVFGNPLFVIASIYIIYKIFGKKHIQLYIEGLVNANLLWIEIVPALYINRFLDIKLVIIGFCIANVFISMELVKYLRRKWVK